MTQTVRKMIPVWAWVILLMFFFVWGLLFTLNSFCKMYLGNILENKKITIYKDGRPEEYNIVRLYYLYDPDRRSITEGAMGEAIVAFSDPFKEIKIKHISFPVCIVAYGEMELYVNLVSGEVRPANELAQKLFALEGKHFFSRSISDGHIDF